MIDALKSIEPIGFLSFAPASAGTNRADVYRRIIQNRPYGRGGSASAACRPVWFRLRRLRVTRIGLEAGPLSQWLYAGMRAAGLAVELIETRHVRDAFKAMPVKTDRKDARGIAQLMRLGWFRSVHCKSLPAQEVRALLTARKLLQTKNHDVEMCLRGVLRGFGLKVGKTTPRTFVSRIRELVDGHATLSVVAESLIAARATLFA